LVLQAGNGRDRESWEDVVVSTRTLIVLAAVTGVAILLASAVQIMLAR
jgi:hypothetical protein